MSKDDKKITLKTLNKSNIWDLQESDILRLWENAQKDADFADNSRHYLDVIKTAFSIEDIKVDKPEVIKKYEDRGFKIGSVKKDENNKQKFAIKKKPIVRVTDLTYENIGHISATKLLEVIDRNFGGGWDSLSQSIKDIIEHGFDISTTTLPKDRLHKGGGLYEKKMADGYEVLEIPKGTWVEAIFAKVKPEEDSLKSLQMQKQEENENKLGSDDEDEDLPNDDQDGFDDEDDDTFDDDKLTEESYRTTFDEDPENLNLEAEDVTDDEDY